MAYFVTGATGFIGRRLVAELVSRREGDIHVLVRPGSVARLERHAHGWGRSPRVVPVSGELTRPGLGVDPGWIAEHAGSIDHVFHLAASYDMTAGAAENDLLNLDGTRHALELAEAVGAGTFHHVSSIAVAGDFSGVFTEEMFDEGQGFPSDYHRTKHGSEALVRASTAVPWRVYRPAVVVGDSRTGEIDKVDGPYYFFPLVKALRSALPTWWPLAAPGLGRTNVVPVDYVARAMDELAHRPGLDGRAFHLVNPEPHSNLELIDTIAQAAGAPHVAASLDNRVTDALAEKLVGPLAARTVGTDLGATLSRPLLRRLGIPPEVLPHLHLAPVFDATATLAALEGSGIAPPPLSTYAGALWDHWEQRLDPAIGADRATRRAVQGRTIMITGATSGIGRATAFRLATLGATVVLVARSAEDLEHMVDEIRSDGGTAVAYPCDLTDLEAVDEMVKEVERDLDGVDVLVNNAGRSIRRSLRLSYDRFHDFERTMQLNYFGAIRLVMGLAPGMAHRKRGHVVNISSIGVQTNPPRFSAYIASKAALDGWTRVVSSELVHRGVTFTTIHMPLVRTPMIAPTRLYDAFPAISSAQAADLVLRAIRDQPHEINTLGGTAGELGHALAPRIAFQVLNRAYHLFPDSAAARGADAGRSASRRQRTLASVLRGVHW
ncbi:NAD-binding protein [Aeromicrobium marinum DSM 15272]|uniref:NAD-binding protein n=1 Tax=Aeromicrobium marinum DSM 15272 TaxID=585531 RepID=E2SFZ2_9ACTN|nr:SDR family oxidoreductase [Aeromicrobium marinum]EFQ81939.1 NAD-binding protein [Aeromicrobium marinum DSM 15272]